MPKLRINAGKVLLIAELIDQNEREREPQTTGKDGGRTNQLARLCLQHTKVYVTFFAFLPTREARGQNIPRMGSQ